MPDVPTAPPTDDLNAILHTALAEHGADYIAAAQALNPTRPGR